MPVKLNVFGVSRRLRAESTRMYNSKPSGPRRQVKLDSSTILPAGTVLSIPLPDGRFGACKVLAVRTPDDDCQPPHAREFSMFVAVAMCIGSRPPDARMPCVDRLMSDERGGIRGVWIAWQPPPEIVAVGKSGVTNADRAGVTNCGSSWAWVVGAAARGLDVRSPIVSPGGRNVVEPASAGIPADEIAAILADATSGRLFSEWVGWRPLDAVVAARTVIMKAAGLFLNLARFDAGGKAGEDAIRNAVEELNRLDGEYRFIDTVEREDVLEVLHRLTTAAGVPSDVDSKIDLWREW